MRQACRAVDANLTIEFVCTFCKGSSGISFPNACAVFLQPVTVAAVYIEVCGCACCHGNGGLFICAAVYGNGCDIGVSLHFVYLCAAVRNGYRRRNNAEAGGIVYEVNGIEFQFLQLRCQIARSARVHLALEGRDNGVCVASVICRARNARDNVIRSLRKGDVVKAERGFQSRCKLT